MDAAFESIKPRMKGFSVFLGDKKFFIGDQVTVADFAMAESMDLMTHINPTFLDEWANLKGLMDRVFNLPWVKQYRASDRFSEHPFNNI